MDPASTRTHALCRLVFGAMMFVLLTSPSITQVNSNAVFDANGASVVVPHAPPLNLAPRLTIELWLKPAPPASAFGAAVDKDYHTGFAFGISPLSGRTDSAEVVLLYAGQRTTGPRVASNDLVWTHLAFSIDTVAHEIAFYVNGLAAGTHSGPDVRFADNSADLRIATSLHGDGFPGLCDEVRIWNVVRSASDITALWNHEAKGNEPGLVAVYHFENERDTVAWNRSIAGGLHGTLSAADHIVLEQWPFAFIDEHEPNGCYASATPLNYESKILEASIAPADTDCFKIWTWPGDVMRVVSAAKNPGDAGDMSISVYGCDTVTHITTYFGGYPSFYTAGSTAGYHYIRVVNRSGAGGSYTLLPLYRGETFVADEYEPNNTVLQATPRPWGKTGYGTIFPGFDAGVVKPDTDYYAYTADANEIGFFVYTLQGVGCGSGYLSMHTATGNLSNTYTSRYQNHRFPSAGTYYVRIRPNEATYRYYWGGFKGLADIQGMLYDPASIGYAVQLCSGMNSAYDNAYMLKINNEWFKAEPNYALSDVDGRQFLFGPDTLAGISVVRKFFVPTAAQGDTLGYMRIQDIMTNTTGSLVTVNVAVYSDLGASPSKVIATSNGDTLFTPEDTWLWTDDTFPTSKKPNLLHLIDGAGGADRVDSVSMAGDDLYWEWRGVTLRPGETKIYLYYVAQDSFPVNAQRKGIAFSDSVLPACAKLGLGADARLVMNWRTEALVSVGPEPGRPMAFGLEQNYPNPFNPTTTLRYSVGGVVAPGRAFSSGVEGPGGSHVKLAVYDLLGREVAVLVDERKEPGHHEVQFDGSGYSSGVYFYRLQAVDPSTGSGRNYVQTRKLLLLR